MKSMFVLMIAALLVFAACATQPTGKVVQETKQTVKIGAILPLSGENAQLGAWAKEGIELAMREVNAQSTTYTYEVIYEDDEFTSKGAATAANKLISMDNVDVIVSFASSQGNAIKPIAAQGKAIHFGVASDPNVADGEYNFIHWTPPAAEAKKFLEKAQSHGVKRLALIGLNHQGVIAIEDEVVKQAPEYGISIVYREHLNGGTTDFRTQLLKLQEQKPDLVMPLFFDPEIGLMLKQYKDMAIAAPIASIEVPGIVKDPSIFDGAWFVNAAGGDAKFAAKFETAYGSQPQMTAANMYDIVKITVDAYETAGRTGQKPPSSAIVQHIKQLSDYEGALGKLRMQPSGIIWSDAEVFTVTDGKMVKVQ
jgi:branched-chain amino acid transport system substrate-binding protein